jgi:4-carboxymuconolactone decarboxylase
MLNDTSLVDTHAREADILGKPQRISPLKPEEIGKDAAESLNKVMRTIQLEPVDEITGFSAVLLRHPALYERHMALALQLFQCELTTRDRELLILRTGWLCQAPNEWGEHVKIGKRLGGLTDEEITRVTVGSSALGWTDHDRALLRAVEELHTDAMISDATWTILAKSLNEQQLLELPILIGQYHGVAYIQNSIRLRLLPGNAGLTER